MILAVYYDPSTYSGENKPMFTESIYRIGLNQKFEMKETNLKNVYFGLKLQKIFRHYNEDLTLILNN